MTENYSGLVASAEDGVILHGEEAAEEACRALALLCLVFL